MGHDIIAHLHIVKPLDGDIPDSLAELNPGQPQFGIAGIDGKNFTRFCRMFRFTPELVMSDLHPDYLSTRFANLLVEDQSGIKHISVQHHHAHIASGMLSAGLEGEVIGLMVRDWGPMAAYGEQR